MTHVTVFSYQENPKMFYICATQKAMTPEAIREVETEEEVTHFTDEFSLRDALSKLPLRLKGGKSTFYNSADHDFVSPTHWTDHKADGGNSTSDVLCETGRTGCVFTVEFMSWRLLIASDEAHRLPFEDAQAKSKDEHDNDEHDEKIPMLPNLTDWLISHVDPERRYPRRLREYAMQTITPLLCGKDLLISGTEAYGHPLLYHNVAIHESAQEFLYSFKRGGKPFEVLLALNKDTGTWVCGDDFMNTHILSRSLSQLKAPAVVWYGDAKEFPAAEDPDELIGIENVTAMVTRGYASAPEPALFVQLGVSSKVQQQQAIQWIAVEASPSPPLKRKEAPPAEDASSSSSTGAHGGPEITT